MEKLNLQNKLPTEVSTWFLENAVGDLISMQPVGGGCINNGLCISTRSGKIFFLKTNQSVPADMFTREAEGLNLLRVEGGPRIPLVYLIGEEFLLLEYLSPSKRNENYWEKLGFELAKLHQKTNNEFGLAEDNYIGSTKQRNLWTEDGFEFFAEQRFIFQAEIATKQSLLTTSEEKHIKDFAKKLPELLPKQDAVLIHGDLWNGNVITGPNGEPAIIDPAVYYGWAEAELAMTLLFGGFPTAFYESYSNSSNLDPGWQHRSDIYNLYHLLNHLNIFGKSYHGRVMSIVNKYS